jgi:uncharacterized protein
VTVYLDTSALVKLYVAERGSAVVRGWLEDARRIVTACITYAEAWAALARGRRVGTLSPGDLRRATRELDADWQGYGPVDVDEAVALRAGHLAEHHALPGYDAVHLAAALAARPEVGEYLFASFDARLNVAAGSEGLRLALRDEEVRERSRPGRRSRARVRVAASGRSR